MCCIKGHLKALSTFGILRLRGGLIARVKGHAGKSQRSEGRQLEITRDTVMGGKGAFW
jgi:hypothetical protein